MFHFIAGAPEGGTFDGQLVAESEADALWQLRQAGYLPLRVQVAPIRRSILDLEISLGNPKLLRVAECENFCRELAILLSSGMELNEALSILTPSLRTGSRLHRLCLSTQQWLRMGSSFSAAIDRTGFVSPPDLIPIIRAGEETGTLPVALTLLAETYRESSGFSRMFVGALIYPGLLLTTAVAAIAIIAFLVAPTLVGLFDSMDRPVPGVIATLDAAAKLVGSNLPLFGFAAIGLMLGGAALVGNRQFRRGVRNVAFQVPVLGSALAWSAGRRFALTLRLYLVSNVALATALPSAFTAAGFPHRQRRAAALADEIRRGGRLSAALEKISVMPAKLIHLVRVGEGSGRLNETLAAIADEARFRFEKQVALVSSLLAPVLIVVVGTIVGAIIFTVFTALLEVNDIAAL